MKVLLFGEFSGLYKNLKEGLQELGHEVLLAADGDGWKKIGGEDITLNAGSRNYIRAAKQLLLLKNYDIVQAISPDIYRKEFNLIAFGMLKKQNGKLLLSAAGDNYFTFKAFKEGKYRYCWIEGDTVFQEYYNTGKALGKLRALHDLKVVSMADGIIPITYDYAEAFRSFPRITKAIPIPINCKKIEYHANRIKNNKVRFFHGINRVIPKGSNYIIAAMKKIKEKYPNDVEISIKKRIPLKEYLKIMSETNVVLDQCKGYSMGLNALMAMAEGKAVLSGNEDEARKELGIESCPAFNIVPDEKQILDTMEHILERRNQMEEIGWESRQYVEKYHSHIDIAGQYISVWESIT